MSTTIDEEVVAMKFDTKEFQRGIQTTLDGLDRLTKALQLDHVAKGVSSTFNGVRRDLRLDDSAKNVEDSAGRIATAVGSIKKALHLGDSARDLNSIPGKIDEASSAGRRFSLIPMISSISEVTHHFSALEVAGVTALATITHKALATASAFTKQFTTAPISAGLQEYETNLNAIQTILANTGLEGPKGLAKVNAALQDLNYYSDKTIYNFSQMARNIGTFTAAGVKLDVATGAIKGIANLAAVSGASADQASTAMYQLSQALASGTVKLMDWNSVVNAGMGGKVFQESLKETARAHHVAVDKIIKDSGSFRDSLQKGWLTSGILTETLSKFTGDLTAKQLKQMGYTDKQIPKILKMGKVATEAATKVKTFHQLIDTLKEAAGSGWTATWQQLFGTFDEARDLFTHLSDTLGGFIQQSANARNKVLADWKKLGGRTLLIKTIGDAFKDLGRILKPIHDGFREIFPRKTGKDLFVLTQHLHNFVESLKVSKKVSGEIKRTFAGVFAIFDIARQVLKGLSDSFNGLFGGFGAHAQSFLELTARAGDWLVALDKMLKKSGDIKAFFDEIKNQLNGVRTYITNFAHSITNLFTSFDSPDIAKFSSAMGDIGKRLSPLKRLAEGIGHLFQGIGRILGKVGDKIKDELGGIGHVIAQAFTSQNFNTALDVLNTSLLGGIVYMLRNFFHKGFKLDLGGGVLNSAKQALDGITGTLKAMQTDIKANALLKIAGALALLTASVVVLSLIDSKKLTRSLVALGAGLAGMSAVMVVLSKQIDTMGTAKLVFISGAMVAISVALLAFSGAVAIMATIPAGDMYRGLFGLGLGLEIISKVMKGMPKGMVLQAVALNGIATSLVILAGALKLFGTIQWDDMGRGLTALAGSLSIIAGAMRIMPKNMVMQAGALTILAVALNGIAAAVKVFGTISWDKMLHGMVGLGGALLIIAGAMHLMPKGMLRQSVALVAVAGALNIISLAVMSMGSMKWESIAKGLVGLGGSLLILAGALNLMNGTLLGSIALVAAAGALAVLAPVLIALGSVSWGVLLKGLGALAAVFVVLGLAGLVLAPLVPVILGLSAAVVLIGAGLALAGVGALAFASAFGILVVAGSAGVSVLADILNTFIKSIPDALVAFAIGIVKFAEELAKGEPQFYAAAVAIMDSILDAIITDTPKIGEAFTTMVETALDVMVELTPKVADAGFQMIMAFLTAVDQNIGGIVDRVTSIVVNFIEAQARNLPKIIQAGVDFILAYINGVANAIRDNSDEMGEAGANLATAIVEGFFKGLASFSGKIADAGANLGHGLLNAAKGVLGIHSPSRQFEQVGKYVNEGLAKGLRNTRASVLEAYHTTATLLRQAIESSAEDIARAQDRLTQLQSMKKKDPKKIAEAKAALAQAQKENAASKSAYDTFVKSLADEKTKLAALATQYEKVTKKLEAARQKLADAKKTRDDYNASVKDQYAQLPDITNESTLDSVRKDLQKQIIDTQKFDEEIQKLRKLGLNDDLYKELLQKGPAALPFIEQLLAGGKTSVDEFNKLDSTLAKEAAKLAKSASKELYQAAVDSAQGLVDGLKKQQASLAKQMEKLADVMVNAIKKKLGIKSPSREFAKVAMMGVAGLAKGFRESSRISEQEAENVGMAAILAMRKTIEGLSEVTDGMDVRPTISPVLDLSDVEEKAKKVAGMFPKQTIKLGSVYSSAKDASDGYDRNRRPGPDDLPPPPPTSRVTFIQNNTSPKALSEAEIYRNTRSQLSRAKGALANAQPGGSP